MRSLAALAGLIASLLTPSAHADEPPVRHLGTPEEAVVGVEVSQADGSRTLTSLGFLVRCDGFVLVPDHVFSQPAKESGRRIVSVVLNPGTDKQRRLSGLLPRATNAAVPYNVFKVPKLHAPAIHARLPDPLKPGDTVVLCWADRDKVTGGYSPAQRRVAHIREAVVSKGSVLEYKIEEPLGGCPLGTLVLDPGGGAIGFLTSTPRDRFRTFEDLFRVTNLVGSSPLHAKAPEAQEEGAKSASSAMVRVPGGRVQMPRGLTRGVMELEGESDVCVPDFEIDEQEVTNEEYLEFLKALPKLTRENKDFESKYYPLGWARGETPFPASLAKWPVVGVAYARAAEYARWRGKRLPTPYEWVRAACGRSSDLSGLPWMKEYVADRQRIYQKVNRAHAEYVAQHPELLDVPSEPLEPVTRSNDPRELARRHAAEERATVARFIGSRAIPWVPNVATPYQMVNFSRDVCVAAYTELTTKWTAPMSLREVGSRDYDVSPFGARDMVMNADEWVLSREGDPLIDEPRYIHTLWHDPQVNQFTRGNFLPVDFPLMPGDAFKPEAERRYSGAGTAMINLSTREPDPGEALNVIRAVHTVGEVVQNLSPLNGCEFAFSDLMTYAVYYDSGRGEPFLIANWIKAYAVRAWLAVSQLREREIGLSEPDVRLTDPPTGYFKNGSPRNQVPGTTGRWRLEYEWQLFPVGFRCAR